MSIVHVEVLERLTLDSPLGVRFRDEATRSFVSDGLSVVAYPEAHPELRTAAVTNNDQVYVFRTLPGLRDVVSAPFIIEVRDRFGRFLPSRTPIDVPHAGIFGIEGERSIPLFSAPSRNHVDGMGLLRAELVEESTRQPAAWAIVEATAGEQRLVRGMADEQGRLMLPLFYPKPVISLASPASNLPLTQQSWSVGFSIRYEPRDPVPDIPDLVDVLTQPLVDAIDEFTSPPTHFTQATLQFGRELQLTTRDANVLLISI